MDSLPVPLWSVGVALIVLGPFVVQRLVETWSAVVERRTDDALSAMTARSKGTKVNVDDGEPSGDVTQDDSADDA